MRITFYLPNEFNYINSSPAQCSTGLYNFNLRENREIRKKHSKKKQYTQATTTEVDSKLRSNFVHFCVHFQLLPNQRLLGSCVNSSKQCVMRGTTKSNVKYKACLLLHTIQMESHTYMFMLQHNWWLWWQNGWYYGLFFHKDFTVISILYSERNMEKQCNTGAGICFYPKVNSKLKKLMLNSLTLLLERIWLYVPC